jgi:hypothetical protein
VIDVPKLKAQVSQRLRNAGITPLEPDGETTHKLIVHLEGIEVPGSDKYVYRIQTALSRLVVVSGLRNRRLQTEVWRVRPVMESAAGADAGQVMSAAVLVQVDAFVGACKAARSVLDLTEDASKDVPAAGVSAPMQAPPQNLRAAASYPFIASKNGAVFHRPDCRWAQNISGDNLVGYQTRDEAVQSGKRPCKSCKP